MRALLHSTVPFWVALFLCACAIAFALLLVVDDYVIYAEEREERRRQRAIYEAEGL